MVLSGEQNKLDRCVFESEEMQIVLLICLTFFLMNVVVWRTSLRDFPSSIQRWSRQTRRHRRMTLASRKSHRWCQRFSLFVFEKFSSLHTRSHKKKLSSSAHEN